MLLNECIYIDINLGGCKRDYWPPEYFIEVGKLMGKNKIMYLLTLSLNSNIMPIYKEHDNILKHFLS